MNNNENDENYKDNVDDEDEDDEEYYFDEDEMVNNDDMTDLTTKNNLNLVEMLLYYKNELSTIPDVKISTITVTANISMINFNIENIGLYFNEFDDIIIGKHYDKKLITSDYIKIIKKKNNSKRIDTNGSFKNQISIIFDTSKLNDSNENLLTTNNKKKKINLKLFRNGSIQCTGLSKKIEIFKKCVDILFEKLKKPKAIYKNNKFIDIYFADQITLLNSNNIRNFSIQMINTNFVCDYNINRSLLTKKLNEEKISVDYDPNHNVSVKIKYKYNEKKYITIMIFESGSISINGANVCKEIDEAYNFINKFNFKLNQKILTKPIDNDIILKLLNEMNNKNII